MRYPISIQTFATIRNGNYVYVEGAVPGPAYGSLRG